MKNLLKYVAWKLKWRWRCVGGHACDKLGRYCCHLPPAGYLYVWMHTRTHEIKTEVNWWRD